ncbi:MAG: hypothetical protein K8J31_09120, partial [Anaerolineae bacterium]|nr:hypothetical protein [Anaerolineae bacterium]
MTGRDRVMAALKFERPDRAPRDLWALPYISLFRSDELGELLREYPTDISVIGSGVGILVDLKHLAQPGHYT